MKDGVTVFSRLDVLGCPKQNADVSMSDQFPPLVFGEAQPSWEQATCRIKGG
jgi:hypothetical protein